MRCKNCMQQDVTVEPDTAKSSIVYRDDEGGVSTIAYPTKLADDDLCYYCRKKIQDLFGLNYDGFFNIQLRDQLSKLNPVMDLE